MANSPIGKIYPKTPDGFESAFEDFLETFPEDCSLNKEWDTAREAFMYAWIAAGAGDPKINRLHEV